MQILPWTIIFVTIFAILSSCFFSESKLIDLLSFTSFNAHQLIMDIDQKKTKKYFKELIKNKPKSNPKAPKEKETTHSQPTYDNPRMKNYRNTTAKLNIASLFHDDPLTIKYVEQLLTYFYGDHPPFNQEEDFEKKLTSMLQTEGKLLKQKGVKITSLTQLFDEKDPNHLLHILLLKGCTNYHYEAKDSYPSLEELFTVDTSKVNTLLCFQDIPYPFLVAIFSQEFADGLIKKEKEHVEKKLPPISPGELSDLLLQHGLPVELLDRLDLKSKPKKTNLIMKNENKSNITYSLPYSFN